MANHPGPQDYANLIMAQLMQSQANMQANTPMGVGMVQQAAQDYGGNVQGALGQMGATQSANAANSGALRNGIIGADPSLASAGGDVMQYNNPAFRMAQINQAKSQASATSIQAAAQAQALLAQANAQQNAQRAQVAAMQNAIGSGQGDAQNIASQAYGLGPTAGGVYSMGNALNQSAGQLMGIQNQNLQPRINMLSQLFAALKPNLTIPGIGNNPAAVSGFGGYTPPAMPTFSAPAAPYRLG